MKQDFRVSWEIDVIAGSPLEAAKEALKIMRDPDNTATVFDVVDSRSEIHRVDILA